MKNITCSQCGQAIPASYNRCPVCGTAVDDQSQTTETAAQKRFTVWFVFLVIFCLFLAFWLPR